ncbi:MAG: hypothetical protein SWJ54_09760 [Cyanobacteriota bacterium]|nr:hypothetical protein [Cyanobacteriota bacterium]
MVQLLQETSNRWLKLRPRNISDKKSEVALESKSNQFSKSNPNQFIRYRFSTILLACLILWTPLLTWETIEVQHSCHPLVNWSNQLAKECTASIDNKTTKDRGNKNTGSTTSKKAPHSPPIINKPQIQKTEKPSNPTPKQTKNKPQPVNQPEQEKKSPGQQVKEHPDLAGATAGIAAAGAVAAIASAPAAVAVGVGILFWLVIRSALSR